MNNRIANDLIRYAELVEDSALISPEEMNCASLMRLAAEALAQPEQEPVAYGMWDSMIGCGGRMMYVRLDKGQDGCTVPLYTIPPQRKLLTDEQWMIEMVDAAMVATRDIVPRITRSQCRLIIEAAHGIKGDA